MYAFGIFIRFAALPQVPSGNWYCQKCASKEKGDHIRCCLCPKLYGE